VLGAADQHDLADTDVLSRWRRALIITESLRVTWNSMGVRADTATGISVLRRICMVTARGGLVSFVAGSDRPRPLAP